MTDSTFDTIWNEAVEQANVGMENRKDSYPCGFAWINIRPARGKFVSYLKKIRIGRTDSYYGGYTVSSNDILHRSVQNVYMKEDACNAVVNVLRKHGIQATMMSRWD